MMFLLDALFKDLSSTCFWVAQQSAMLAWDGSDLLAVPKTMIKFLCACILACPEVASSSYL